MKQRVHTFSKIIVIIIFSLIANISISKAQFAETSVLAEGTWYKFAVLESGIYKIDAQWLRQAGFSPETLNPNNLHLFGNNSGMLPQLNGASRLDDLQENAIWIAGSQDARFDEQDYILFYAQSPHAWQLENTENIFKQEKNLFSDTTYYYLNLNNQAGLRIENQTNLTGATFTVDYFDETIHHEKDDVSIIQSGREWYGENFGFQNIIDFVFDTEGLRPNSEIVINSAVMARANQVSKFQISTAGQMIGEQSINPVTNQNYDFKGRDAENTFRFASSLLINPNQIALKLTYVANGNNGTGYLNYLNLNFQRILKLYGTQTIFQNLKSLQHPFTSFTIQEMTSEAKVWDISNPILPKLQEGILSSNQFSFTSATSTLRKFVVWKGQNFPLPIPLYSITNQNLHGLSVPNLVIVTPPAFRAQAQRLADFRESHDGLTVAVVSTEEVYNEFASGKRDITAIRDFMRMLYQRDAQTLKYLLLFGDASYDYKNRVANNTNWVPVYESRQSLHPIFSYSSDDYFGFLEGNEGEWIENSSGDHTLEIGIGRLPVKNNSEARTVVDKLIHYSQSPQSLGKWRNQIAFVADDGDSNTHQRDADRLTEMLEEGYENIEMQKLYMDAFEQISTPNGELCPDLNEAITQSVEKGSLIINFTGHGAERGWTEEKILETPNIPAWRNMDKLSVFVTATCEFGRYDNPAETSGAEVALLTPQGAGVALITTTRPVFSSTNFLLNEAFYNTAFEPLDPSTGEMPRLGDILKFTKNNSLNGSINRNFSLLGDPSMKMAYPKHKAVITHINDQDIEVEIDTLKALASVNIKGEIQNASGSLLSDFNGILDLDIFDKRETKQTLGKAAAVMNFKVRENKFFSGKVSVINGRFEANFIIPRDMNYQFGYGKIMMYAQPASGLEDANGGNKNIVIGGSTLNAPADNTPPEVTLYLNNENFVNGGVTGRNSLLIANIFDQNGINISRAGIGHEIIAVLDENTENPIILNDYFVNNLNSYQQGRVEYSLKGISPGRHTLRLRVWDTYNNPQDAEIEFFVEPSLQIKSFKNYPNPVRNETTFEFEHNLGGENITVDLEIFNTQGGVVKRLRKEISNSSESLSLKWDGLDQVGQRVGNGLYIYRLTLQAAQLGVSAQVRQELIVIN